MKILIVDDEPSMRMGLKDNLEFEGYQVDTAEDGVKGLEKMINNKFDLVLLDVMMPNMSGLDVCKSVREKGVGTPIILLTAKGEEIDKVLGLELGADDYITKPFSVRELMARIKAVLRRGGTKGGTDIPDKLLIGNLELKFSSYTAQANGQSVKMSHKEFEILQYLWQHRNDTVSRYDLLEDIWGYDESPTTRTVDNFILKLRQKVEDNPNEPRIILTVHGVGYKLVASP